MRAQDPAPAPLAADEPAPIERPSFAADLRESLRDLVRYRELLAELVMRDLRIRYKQAVMGVAWAVLTPLVVALAGWVVRLAMSAMAGAPIDRSELAGVAVKAVAWSFFIGALGFGTASITANLALVTKVYFPRGVLPISAVLTQFVDSVVGGATLALVLPLLGVRPSLAALWFPPLVVLLLLLTTGITLLASCANVFFRDARHVVGIVTGFGIFFTPVFFDASAFGEGAARWLMLNPLGPILEGMRLSLVEGHDLLEPLVGAQGRLLWSPWYLAASALWATAGLAVATVVFHRAEFAFAEYV
jgi:ABC-type polysaccharide/polyol phosphate export permease